MAKRGTTTLPGLSADVARMVEDFDRETDRGVALLAAAFLDDVMDVMLRAVMVDEPDAVNRLMGTGRALESFGARVHLAYCMGLLGRDVYHDLNLIREIRNDFAHRQPTNFEGEEIRGKCQRLKAASTVMADAGCTARERFTATVVMLANHLIVTSQEMKHATCAKDFAVNGVLRLK
jgi:DNA-binding MltR family transcriptional regulator